MRPTAMASTIASLLFELLKHLIDDCLQQTAIKVCAWLDTKLQGRVARLALGGLLGLAAYFIYPIIMGLF